jgi:hypothetical protein
MVAPCGGIGSTNTRASSPDQCGTSARAGAVGRTGNANTSSTDNHVVHRLNRMAKVNQTTGEDVAPCASNCLGPIIDGDDGYMSIG